MIYCDTSLVIAALTPEIGSAKVLQWLGVQEAGSLCVSGWVGTEVSSALSIKLRRGDLTPEQRADVLMHWRRLAAASLVVVPVPLQAWDLAASFADRHESKLRAGDALHLAVASLGGHALATLDQVMAAAALQFGISVVAV